MIELLYAIIGVSFLWAPALLFFCTNIDRGICAVISCIVIVVDMLFWKWIEKEK